MYHSKYMVSYKYHAATIDLLEVLIKFDRTKIYGYKTTVKNSNDRQIVVYK